MSKIPVLVWLPAAFVIGGLVGYYGPAEELRMREIRAKEEAKAKPSVNNALGSFAQMVNIPAEAKRPRRRPAPPGQEGAADTNEVAESGGPGHPPGDNKPPENFSPEDLRARIDEAADLWRARIDVAKAAAVERLGLDSAGQQKFEASLTAMNDRIRDSIQTIAEGIANDEKMTHETNVRLLGDLATTLAEAYDEIGECVDEKRRGEVSEMMLLEFIDPSVAEPLISVQDKIDGLGPMEDGRDRQ